MKPTNKKLYLWSAVILALIAVARALQHYFVVDVNEPVQFGLWWHIPFNLFLWWSWLFFIPLIGRSVLHAEAGGEKVGHSLRTFFLLPVLVIAARQVAAAFIIATVLEGYSDFETQVVKRIVGNQWLWLDIAVYFIIVIGIRVADYREKTEESAVKVGEIRKQLVRSQLSALESQLHPHFLFNTLNTLSTMIVKKENAEAVRMLSLLQKYLHATVYDSRRHEATLEEEIGFIRDYLDIEKVRFSDKLEVIYRIAEETHRASVPGFLLQPVVENAVYHAVAPKSSGGIIRISAGKGKDRLVIAVEDNGPGMPHARPKKPHGGVGLKITEERLKRMYGNTYTLSFSPSDLGGLNVSIRIPFTLHGEEGRSS